MKPIFGFEGYFIDELGNTFSNRPKCRGGIPPTIPRLLCPKTGKKNGYLYVILQQWDNGVWVGQRSKYVHRLVLETFVGPAPPGTEGCHNDGVRTNNRVENLRWDTRMNNQRDRKKHGTHTKVGIGERSGSAKLTELQVRIIRQYCRLDGFGSQTRIAKIFGVDSATVNQIVNNETWKHITVHSPH